MPWYILLMKWQFVITDAICHTEILALQDSWVANTLSVKMLCSQKNCCSWYLHKNVACRSVGLLRNRPVIPISCNIVCQLDCNKLPFHEWYLCFHLERFNNFHIWDSCQWMIPHALPQRHPHQFSIGQQYDCLSALPAVMFYLWVCFTSTVLSTWWIEPAAPCVDMMLYSQFDIGARTFHLNLVPLHHPSSGL